MTLPADVARCLGTDLPECATCRRAIVRAAAEIGKAQSAARIVGQMP